MLYSNLLKSGTTVVTEEKKKVIDTNELIAKKLENYRKEQSRQSGFRAGLQAEEIELADPEDAGTDAGPGVPAETAVYDGPSPEELLNQAEEEIAKMRKKASEELEEERKNVLEKAKKEGFDQGFETGQKQGEALADEKIEQLEKQKLQMQKEYQEKVEELEPDLVDTITRIYEKVFDVELKDYRGIIVYLISTAMSQIEGARNFLIHVSKEDYSYVSIQKKEIVESSVGGNVSVEIVEDVSLKKNECLIETEGGIFDCGLGTQLEELEKKLKLLSYEKD